jgi:triacylglycerol esterase/lipase EstA (alpha/beta hydrolase family)
MTRRLLASLVGIGALVLALVGSQPVQAASNPVLVVAGLTETTSQLQTILNRLSADGFTAVGMQLPGAIAGCGDIAQSSQAVANRARQLQSQTGAARIDVIGHSEGGLELRFFIKNLGGASIVQHYVSLGTPQHGTNVANLAAGLGAFCPAAGQMAPNSTFLSNLDSGTDVPGAPAVSYTALGTTRDTAVTPAPQASFLRDGGTNAAVQTFCPNDTTSHVGLLSDAPTYLLARSALLGQPLTTNCSAT